MKKKGVYYELVMAQRKTTKMREVTGNPNYVH